MDDVVNDCDKDHKDDDEDDDERQAGYIGSSRLLGSVTREAASCQAPPFFSHKHNSRYLLSHYNILLSSTLLYPPFNSHKHYSRYLFPPEAPSTEWDLLVLHIKESLSASSPAPPSSSPVHCFPLEMLLQ